MFVLRGSVIICWVLSAIALAQSATDLKQSRTTSVPEKAKADTHKPSVSHLVRVQTITAVGEFATSFFRPFRCDSDGNLYVRTDAGGVEAVHKLNSKGERVALFEANSNPDLKIDAARYFTVGDGGNCTNSYTPMKWLGTYLCTKLMAHINRR